MRMQHQAFGPWFKARCAQQSWFSTGDVQHSHTKKSLMWLHFNCWVGGCLHWFLHLHFSVVLSWLLHYWLSSYVVKSFRYINMTNSFAVFAVPQTVPHIPWFSLDILNLWKIFCHLLRVLTFVFSVISMCIAMAGFKPRLNLKKPIVRQTTFRLLTILHISIFPLESSTGMVTSLSLLFFPLHSTPMYSLSHLLHPKAPSIVVVLLVSTHLLLLLRTAFSENDSLKRIGMNGVVCQQRTLGNVVHH